MSYVEPIYSERLDPPEARLFGHCDWCGDEIWEGYDYYDINGDIVCCDCIAGCKQEAWIDDNNEWDDDE